MSFYNEEKVTRKAEELAEERFQTDFWELSEHHQIKIWDEAEQDVASSEVEAAEQWREIERYEEYI